MDSLSNERGRAAALVAAHIERRRGDGGTAALETAIVAPILFMLLFGILEFGILFKNFQALGNAARAGGRMASVSANAVDADYNIIQAVKKGNLAAPSSGVKRLVVWKASGPGATVPLNCTTAAAPSIDAANQCNIYAPSRDWNPPDPDGTGPLTPASNYDCVTQTWANGWCPTSRIAALNPNGPDYVGIYIEYSHQFVTKLFGSSKNLSSTTIVRIEPKTLN